MHAATTYGMIYHEKITGKIEIRKAMEMECATVLHEVRRCITCCGDVAVTNLADIVGWESKQ